MNSTLKNELRHSRTDARILLAGLISGALFGLIQGWNALGGWYQFFLRNIPLEREYPGLLEWSLASALFWAILGWPLSRLKPLSIKFALNALISLLLAISFSVARVIIAFEVDFWLFLFFNAIAATINYVFFVGVFLLSRWITKNWIAFFALLFCLLGLISLTFTWLDSSLNISADDERRALTPILAVANEKGWEDYSIELLRFDSSMGLGNVLIHLSDGTSIPCKIDIEGPPICDQID
jgi:hypothetical protein